MYTWLHRQPFRRVPLSLQVKDTLRQIKMSQTLSAEIMKLNVQIREDITMGTVVQIQAVFPICWPHIEVIIEVYSQVQRVVGTVKHQQLLPRDNIPDRHVEYFTVALQWPDVFVYVSVWGVNEANVVGPVQMVAVHIGRLLVIPVDLQAEQYVRDIVNALDIKSRKKGKKGKTEMFSQRGLEPTTHRLTVERTIPTEPSQLPRRIT